MRQIGCYKAAASKGYMAFCDVEYSKPMYGYIVNHFIMVASVRFYFSAYRFGSPWRVAQPLLLSRVAC